MLDVMKKGNNSESKKIRDIIRYFDQQFHKKQQSSRSTSISVKDSSRYIQAQHISDTLANWNSAEEYLNLTNLVPDSIVDSAADSLDTEKTNGAGPADKGDDEKNDDQDEIIETERPEERLSNSPLTNATVPKPLRPLLSCCLYYLHFERNNDNSIVKKEYGKDGANSITLVVEDPNVIFYSKLYGIPTAKGDEWDQLVSENI